MVLGVMKGTKLDLHEKLLERNVFTKVRKHLLLNPDSTFYFILFTKNKKLKKDLRKWKVQDRKSRKIGNFHGFYVPNSNEFLPWR